MKTNDTGVNMLPEMLVTVIIMILFMSSDTVRRENTMNVRISRNGTVSSYGYYVTVC